MTDLVVHPATGPLTGSVPVPPDPAIAQAALFVGAIAHGEVTLSGLSRGVIGSPLVRCLQSLGVAVEERGHDLVLRGVGLDGLLAQRPLDCGDSESTLVGLIGLLAATPARVSLTGGPASARWPLRRVVEPLRARGVAIAAKPRTAPDGGVEIAPPITVGPLLEGRVLGPLEHESLAADPSLKTALLLSGLFADGPTRLREPAVSRDHVERLLTLLGAPVRTMGPLVEIEPAAWDRTLPPFAMQVPGDLSSAAFVLAAAQGVPGSRVTLRGVGVNPTRSGWLEIARDMGAGLVVEPQGEHTGEPVALLHAWSSSLTATSFGGELVVRAAVDLPAACTLAARAHGTTRLRDTRSITADGSDSVAAMIAVLRSFGVACDEKADGVDIHGRVAPLDGADVTSEGDACVAMSAAVLALGARAPSRVRDADCIASRYPKFVATLRALGARIDVEA